jgi:pimeloyl-ACP methyl ester carboxylesterase
VQGQIEELFNIIHTAANPPMTLIGHSWGAWLGYIFASQHPQFARKLILIGAGPFEECFTSALSETRLGRMTEAERLEFRKLQDSMADAAPDERKEKFARIGMFLSKTDAYDLLPFSGDVIDYRPDIYDHVWPEAAALRRSGDLLRMGEKIMCPVVAIHGDFDPHPADGVRTPLSKIVHDFRFILLDRCGHSPWVDRFAHQRFFEILCEELEK